jgi:hypothetical protein
VRRPTAPAAALLAALALAPGCALWRDDAPAGARPDAGYGVRVVEDPDVVEFYQSAAAFYGRLRLRRVNSLATYRDEELRDYFRTDSAFADYYADLAQSLAESHFERNRPLDLEVVEFRVEGAGVAEVVTRIQGENGLPLRWWGTEIERVDRWERIQGRWWIVPSKL